MAYCNKCGAEVDNNAKFCGNCGNEMQVVNPASDTGTRQTVYEGTVLKCPNCGAVLDAFVTKCSECGYEIRDINCNKALNEFSKMYYGATTNSQKIDLIKTYAIPNTREDILEFTIMVSSNIDISTYLCDDKISFTDSEKSDVTEAWLVKLEQIKQKARLVLENQDELAEIEKIYVEKEKLCIKGRKKKRRLLRQKDNKLNNSNVKREKKNPKVAEDKTQIVGVVLSFILIIVMVLVLLYMVG